MQSARAALGGFAGQLTTMTGGIDAKTKVLLLLGVGGGGGLNLLEVAS